MYKVEIPDRRRFPVTLADGWPMDFHCDPAGLISAYDFVTDDGGVLRVERRLVEVLPGLSPLDGRTPSYWAECEETRNRDKALFVALWNGMTTRDRASFLRNVVGLRDDARKAA